MSFYPFSLKKMIGIKSDDYGEKNRNFMYICFASQIVVFGLLDMAYLDHFFVLHLCQFNKSNLSISTPNPNECQKYIDYGEDKGYGR